MLNLVRAIGAMECTPLSTFVQRRFPPSLIQCGAEISDWLGMRYPSKLIFFKFEKIKCKYEFEAPFRVPGLSKKGVCQPCE